MRVGILTFHHVYNYGALLQTYALQTFLRNSGHEPIVCNVTPFRRLPPSLRRLKRPWRSMASTLRGLGLIPPGIEDRNFDAFREREIAQTRRYVSIRDCVDSEALHTVVVGSDQVWAPRFGREAMETYFLRGVSTVTKVAYAACAGSQHTRAEELRDYADDLRSFSTISVRDAFTADLVFDVTGRSATRVVDPVLLIPWDSLRGPESPSGTTPYVFYYGASSIGSALVRRLQEEHGFACVSFGMDSDGLPEGTEFCTGGPEDWVRSIARAAVVVTKSFHGMMFALAFGKPALITVSEPRAAGRIVDAATAFGAEHLLVQSMDEVEGALGRLRDSRLTVDDERVRRAVAASGDLLLGALNG